MTNELDESHFQIVKEIEYINIYINGQTEIKKNEYRIYTNNDVVERIEQIDKEGKRDGLTWVKNDDGVCVERYESDYLCTRITYTHSSENPEPVDLRANKQILSSGDVKIPQLGLRFKSYQKYERSTGVFHTITFKDNFDKRLNITSKNQLTSTRLFRSYRVDVIPDNISSIVNYIDVLKKPYEYVRTWFYNNYAYEEIYEGGEFKSLFRYKIKDNKEKSFDRTNGEGISFLMSRVIFNFPDQDSLTQRYYYFEQELFNDNKKNNYLDIIDRLINSSTKNFIKCLHDIEVELEGSGELTFSKLVEREESHVVKLIEVSGDYNNQCNRITYISTNSKTHEVVEKSYIIKEPNTLYLQEVEKIIQSDQGLVTYLVEDSSHMSIKSFNEDGKIVGIQEYIMNKEGHWIENGLQMIEDEGSQSIKFVNEGDNDLYNWQIRFNKKKASLIVEFGENLSKKLFIQYNESNGSIEDGTLNESEKLLVEIYKNNPDLNTLTQILNVVNSEEFISFFEMRSNASLSITQRLREILNINPKNNHLQNQN